MTEEFGMGDIKRKTFNELVECLGRDMSVLKNKMDELHKGMALLSENQRQLGEEVLKALGQGKPE